MYDSRVQEKRMMLCDRSWRDNSVFLFIKFCFGTGTCSGITLIVLSLSFLSTQVCCDTWQRGPCSSIIWHLPFQTLAAELVLCFIGILCLSSFNGSNDVGVVLFACRLDIEQFYVFATRYSSRAFCNSGLVRRDDDYPNLSWIYRAQTNDLGVPGRLGIN
jgi:hypothetical protein